MAFVPSYESRVLLGALNLSCEIRNMSIESTTDIIDVSVICNKPKAFIAGQDSSTFSADGPLNVSGSTNDPFDILTDFKSAGLPLTYAPSGLTTGTDVLLADTLESNYTSSNTSTGSADFSLAAQVTGVVDSGVSVEDLAAITATGNGSARDLTASSTNGGVAHMHVTAFSGLTSDVVTIEQSSNGSTGWTTLVTFATVTGVTSERVVVASGTSVARYLRVVDTVTGTGSVTRAVSFARR